ncbi:hypothetical protein NSERUTF1_0883 [Nocardia seriolae]|nr:hypothetical protein NSERUTF1_0883 [Nocardia seriolae]
MVGCHRIDLAVIGTFHGVRVEPTAHELVEACPNFRDRLL